MHKALHHRDDKDYMCQEKKEDSLDVLMRELKHFIKNSKEWLIISISHTTDNKNR